MEQVDSLYVMSRVRFAITAQFFHERRPVKLRILINAIPWMLLHSDTATAAAFFHSPTPWIQLQR